MNTTHRRCSVRPDAGRGRAPRLVAVLVAVASPMFLGACGITSDSTPRDIPAQEQLPVSGGDSQAGAATGTARVYLLTPETTGQASTLVAVARDVVESPEELLRALMAGPNEGELDRQLRTALPVGMELRSATRKGVVLVIDVSRELQQVSGQPLVLAVAQIVFTASELSGVRSVQILVEGASRQWPAGNGEVQSDPLTVYDFPGQVQSAQPAYPAIPSPEAE